MKNPINSLSKEGRSTILAILVMIIFLIISVVTRGQSSSFNFPDTKKTEGFLVITGYVKDSLEKKMRSEVTVEVLNVMENTKDIIKVKSGSFNAGLMLNYDYKITFICEGYASKTIIINTDVDKDFRNYFFQFDIIMLKKVMLQQVAEVFFENKNNQFSYKLNKP